jgi:pSer/pThr/pTyr-binding forkhead associated (FHA) protein
MPNLKITDQGREYTYQIEGDSVTIGRAPSNTVEIHDAKASKEHCRIERVGNRWKVVDLESKNGTRVNGAFRNKSWLHHGDTIEIGATKVRFGLEGAQRAAPTRSAPAPSGRAASAGRAAPARRAGRRAPARGAPDEEYDEDEPRRPPPKRITSDVALKWGLALLGTVIVFVIAAVVAKKISRDPYNLEVLARANNLVNQGRYDEAEKYLQQHGDPDGSGYIEVTKRIQQIQAIKDNYYRNVKEQGALKVVSKLGRRIKAYHAGKDVQPEQILELVEQLKTEYAGTEKAAEARKLWRSWFSGRVPRRAVDLLTSGSRKREDWEEAVARADAFRKEWRFREARETIDRYITVRESIFNDEDLAYYKELRDQQLDIIDRLAASVYEGRASVARRLVKNKRFDAAIQVYQEVVDKFGIDFYVRKAQAEIEKINALK